MKLNKLKKKKPNVKTAPGFIQQKNDLDFIIALLGVVFLRRQPQ